MRLLRKGSIATFFVLATAVYGQYPKMDAALSSFVDSVKAGVSPFAVTATATGQGRGRGAVPPFQSNYAKVARTDQSGRVLVDIYLDGSASIDQVSATLVAAGADITGVDSAFRFGGISAFVPLGSLEAISGIPGLNVMKFTPRPQLSVGAVTSQGATAFHSITANANGFVGTGITVGVLSDSYNTSPGTFTAIRAANDIASNDLVTPKFVLDLAAASGNTDEGRGMMQIVHDVAPAADLCFATAFSGESAFAANIRTLRTNPTCNADVIVDDVFYFDEPFYSDGQVAQAVNDVSTSTILAGKKISYFSSAGNQGGAGGGSINVPAGTFSTTPSGLGNINLANLATCASVPAGGSTKADVAGGWLDFGGGSFFRTVTYSNTGSDLILQWDDRFYNGAVTTDLNWYMFDSTGACVFTFAGNNFTADNGMEFVSLNGGPSGTYRLMIGRTTPGTHLASRVRMLNLGGWGGAAFIATNPTTFGHSAAASANSVAAYRYSVPFTANPFTPAIESFTSPGPATIAFDAAGNRLAVAETRKKPDMAAPDGGDTTFFFPGQDPDATGFPNFFGTSAAAPHAAGVAALLLQKAGGPSSLTPQQIKSVLQTTAPARVPPFTASPAVKGFNVFDGYGLIDALTALAKIP